MNALRPSLRNDSFVSLVAGILVAALMLVGGPTAYAFAPRCAVPVSLPLNCDGPPGTIAAPLGECDGDVTEADLAAIQTELWTSIFGTSDVPNLSYNLAAGSEFIGRGDYVGVNAYAVTFAIKVHEYTEAFAPQIVNGDTLTGWHVFAEVTGPTETPIPVIGLMMRVDRAPNSSLPGGMGFVMAGRMSDGLNQTIQRQRRYDDAHRPDAGPQLSPGACATVCINTWRAAKQSAWTNYAADLEQASGTLAGALVMCASGLPFPPLGVLIATVCARAAMIIWASACSAAAVRLWDKLNLADTAYMNCMLGCGFTVVWI